MFSRDALQAFVEAAALGSFSAAARKLGKSQSTISTAIAHLELDCGFALFDRSGRSPQLTRQGWALLGRAEAVLAADDGLRRAANEMADGAEPRLTLALSDTYQSDRLDEVLAAFQTRYPELALECLIAEGDDLVALIRDGRAHIGFVEARPTWPAQLAARTVGEPTEIGLFVAVDHPLAVPGTVDADTLGRHRALRLATVLHPLQRPEQGRSWAAPSYLMLMEMAQRGFGWAALPRWLVARFAAGSLVELQARGWPRRVNIDMLWSQWQPPGPAGAWLIARMLEADGTKLS
jgi:DNA-binding transcriptional LysR family regulator